MGLGPVDATNQALRRAGLTSSDIDLFEINEAFAAQVIPSALELGIPMEKLNVNGGAIALGHPFGQTGARIMTTLIHNLQSRGGRYGVETMCVGGGQGHGCGDRTARLTKSLGSRCGAKLEAETEREEVQPVLGIAIARRARVLLRALRPSAEIAHVQVGRDRLVKSYPTRRLASSKAPVIFRRFR